VSASHGVIGALGNIDNRLWYILRIHFVAFLLLLFVFVF